MLSDETLLLLNRATLTVHTVRTAVHELNNILQMVGGYAELLQSAPDLPPGAVRRVDAILRQTTRGQAVLQGVTELTRPGAAAGVAVDAGQAVERALASRHYEHTRTRIAVTLETAPGDLRARIAPAHLEQILLNLLMNAEQAVSGREGASIGIALARTENRIEVRISDSGGGLPPGIDPFQPFTTTRPAAAAGLGLAAARLLADRYDGSLEGPAVGATAWTLRLPAAGPS
jgi:signal transduction histidine kinase